MKNSIPSRITLAALAAIVAVSGCQKDDERLTAADTAAITEEATVDSYFQDIDDLGAVAIDAPTDAEYTGGRTSGTITIEDERFNCEGVVVTIEPTGTADSPSGVLTVDFGTGCTDLRGNVRKGKLIFTYDGWRYQQGSTVVMTTDNYYINDIKLEGTRTSSNVTTSQSDPPKFNVVLENGIATFPDNTVAERESDITWSWIREANPTQDKLIIHANSTASGITRTGKAYEVSLLEQLQYNRFCGIAVSGIKKYVVDGTKEITINYGDGVCDNKVAVTVNGVTHNITIQ